MRAIGPVLVLVITGCLGTVDPSPAIRTVMREQEHAWDAGDIHGFMQGYSDTVCFQGRSGVTCGKEAVEANYLRSYPDRASMGDLTFVLHEVIPAGERAWVTGTWELVRTEDTVGGGFSLFWAEEREGWRIVRDHTY